MLCYSNAEVFPARPASAYDQDLTRMSSLWLVLCLCGLACSNHFPLSISFSPILKALTQILPLPGSLPLLAPPGRVVFFALLIALWSSPLAGCDSTLLRIAVCPLLWACMPTQLLSQVRLCAAPWTAACQAPLSMGFSRQEHWNGLPFLLLGLFQPRDRTLISCIGRQILYYWATWDALFIFCKSDFA